MKKLNLLLMLIYTLNIITCMDTTNQVIDDIEKSEILSTILYNDRIKLPAPSNLEGKALSASRIELTWNDNSTGETGFKIERSLKSADDFKEIGQVDKDIKTYTDTGLTYNTKYYYRIRSYNKNSESKFSNIAHCTTDPKKDSWSKFYGGKFFDTAYSIQETKDEGFIVAGVYHSSEKYGDEDVWILKLDCNGDLVWDTIYGLSEFQDNAYSVQETSDGGYIVAGFTYSYGKGQGDVWIIKLNKDGVKEWDKVYGDECNNWANFIRETKDGGFIITGISNDFITSYDVIIIKLDNKGEMLWDRRYGGNKRDYSREIWETEDGGFIVAGSTESYGNGDSDMWILKLDAEGRIGSEYPNTWEKTYGGIKYDSARSIKETTDGYIIAGSSESYGVNLEDMWILKIDKEGTIIWEKIYDNKGYGDKACSIQTIDDGYIVAGYRGYNWTDKDFWIVKLDINGDKLWDKSYGDNFEDNALSIQQTTDKGYIVAGYTYLYKDAKFSSDMWIMKLDKDGNCDECQ